MAVDGGEIGRAASGGAQNANAAQAFDSARAVEKEDTCRHNPIG